MFTLITKIGLIYRLLKATYPSFRPIVKEAIDDPEKDWDEKAMAALDLLLGYKK